MGSLGYPGRHDGTDSMPWNGFSADVAEGWVGTCELPGYRAGVVIVRLADLPGVDAEHLYLDVLRLGANGRIEETVSGACPAMARSQPLEARSRFVRVVAELLRHAVDAQRSLVGLGAAITLLREGGVEGPQLALAAQHLDASCSEEAVATGLAHLLVLSLGEEDAAASLDDLLARLLPHACAGDELTDRVGLLVRCVGRAQARRRLREATDFELLPTPELLGL